MTALATTEQLRTYVSGARSGEFICASPTVEVHVFLQRGRVAWATDSAHPFVFARYLKEHCKIDDDVFSQVLDSCRRDRLPVGETLVAWDLATWDDVVSALRHQLRLALSTLAKLTSSGVSTIFLDRQSFAQYDERLTFDLTELLESYEGDGPKESARGTSDPTTSFAQALLASIRGARWVQILDSGRVVDAAVKTGEPAPAALHELAQRTLDDGADFVALRSPDGSLLGGVIESSRRQLWCAISSNAHYGAAFAAISALTSKGGQRYKPNIRSKAPIAWVAGDVTGGWATELKQVFEYGGDVLAVGLVDAAGVLIAGMGSAELARDQFERLVAHRRCTLVVESPEVVRRGELEALGFRYQTLVTGEPGVWCFGSESFRGEKRPTLWVLVRREAPQGVGWACLSAFSRIVSDGEAP